MLVMRNVLRGGRRSGVMTTFGICTGLFVHALLSAFGVSLILMHSATAFHIVKLAGACYLIGIGGQSLVSAVRTPRTDDEIGTTKVNSRKEGPLAIGNSRADENIPLG